MVGAGTCCTSYTLRSGRIMESSGHGAEGEGETEYESPREEACRRIMRDASLKIIMYFWHAPLGTGAGEILGSADLAMVTAVTPALVLHKDCLLWEEYLWTRSRFSLVLFLTLILLHVTISRISIHN